MSDDHEALAREQERELGDMEQQSETLGEHIGDAKREAADLESSATIATPDASVEAIERRPPVGTEGPSQPADES